MFDDETTIDTMKFYVYLALFALALLWVLFICTWCLLFFFVISFNFCDSSVKSGQYRFFFLFLLIDINSRLLLQWKIRNRNFFRICFIENLLLRNTQCACISMDSSQQIRRKIKYNKTVHIHAHICLLAWDIFRNDTWYVELLCTCSLTFFGDIRSNRNRNIYYISGELRAYTWDWISILLDGMVWYNQKVNTKCEWIFWLRWTLFCTCYVCMGVRCTIVDDSIVRGQN